MRDLDFNEVRFVYGAGGTGCSPTPPSCDTKGSKSKTSMPKGSKAKTSAHKASKSKTGSCYC